MYIFGTNVSIDGLFKKSELNSPHEKYIRLLMNKICAISVPPWIEFCLKAKLPVPEIISTQHHHMLLDLKRFRCLFALEDLTISGYL